MSEGLLLVTNDGDLANKLTKAGSGVEKVYLVKVAGQPTEAELDLLRAGVNIERGKPGSPQVRTSPARIRQVRQGDNPWYEVVLIEGRNRELRKMFVAVGHFVEKIRRVGYGPLVLDQEPGNMRELDAEELAALRLAAEGKLRTPKAKDVRRRNLADAQLPTVRPKPSPLRPSKPFEGRKPLEPRKFEKGPAAAERPGEFKPRPSFGPSTGKDKPFRPAPPAGEGFRPAAGRAGAEPRTFTARKFGPPGSRPARPSAEKPAWKKDDRGARPSARFAPRADGEVRPPAARPYGDRPATGRTFGSKPAAGRTFGSKPAGRPFAGKPSSGKPSFGKPEWKKPGGSDRPPFKPRPAAPRREPQIPAEDFTPFKPGGLRIDPMESGHTEPRAPRTFSKPPAHSGAGRPPYERPRTGKPSFGKPRFEKPRPERAGSDRPRSDRGASDRPRFNKPGFERPGSVRSSSSGAGPSGQSRPPRSGSGLGRPFTTSSGKPRAGGARPSSKPFKPGGSSKPRPGGFSKSGPKGPGFKGKPGGAKRSGPRAGGKKRG
jgi:23S rRNA pseudouridine2605 synthase